jgi:hypothetical protein
MKEALMIIASAWSTAFILLFLLFVVTDKASTPEEQIIRAHVIVTLFIGAVTGSGWLWFRSHSKKHRAYT